MLKYRWSALLLLLVASFAHAQEASLSHLVDQLPTKVEAVTPEVYLVDFGRVAFGNLSLTPTPGITGPITVRFGEALKGGRIDRNPPGSVRYAEVQITPKGTSPVIVAPPADKRNTTYPAVRTPEAWGVVMPFRWVEVEGWPTLRRKAVVRRAAFDASWSDDAASFHSSDPMLDRIWDLCHYSIKATTFAGIFVDGDRERLAYEADAYLDQLGYYAGDADPRMPRATFDRLMQYPTWPTEWAPHMVFIAYADWMETGDRAWLSAHYESLKAKLLDDRVGPDGLVTSSPRQKGAWHWISDHEVHWRPATYWKAGTDVTVDVDVNSVPAGAGIYGQESRRVSFHVGDAVVSKVDAETHQMRTFVNGVLARTTPITTGKPGSKDYERQTVAYVAKSGTQWAVHANDRVKLYGSEKLAKDAAQKIAEATTKRREEDRARRRNRN